MPGSRPLTRESLRKDTDMQNIKDITYVAAFPKSGITYLNFMLFHILFDRPQDVRLIDSDYIFDVHESLSLIHIFWRTAWQSAIAARPTPKRPER